MQKYRTDRMNLQLLVGDCFPPMENHRDVYLASDVDARIAELRGALADIAFSKDMTLEVARAKAKRIYESTSS